MQDPDVYFDTWEAFDELVVDVNAEWMLFRDLFLETANFALFEEAGALVWLHIRGALLDQIQWGLAVKC